MSKPRVAIFDFACCEGCQLQIVNLEEDILGLIGLVSFITERKTREIGIRKVLGATTAGIIFFLNREHLKLLIYANIAALPLSYLVTGNMLQAFSYRIGLSPWIFVVTAVFVLSITILTVSSQSYKAALANPADSIKHE